MNEDHVAFHEIVMLLGWRDSSNQGPKIILGLDSRASLEHFDKATRRKGKKAGQRYHASFLSQLDPAMPLHPEAMDLWFTGANWAHQDGARVVFTVDDEGLEFFKSLNAKDSRHGTPTLFWLTMVQVDEDETAINQRAQDRLEAAMAPSVPGEGPEENGEIVGAGFRSDGTPHKPQLDAAGLESDSDLTRDTESLAAPMFTDLPPNIVIDEKPKGGPHSKNVAMLCQDDEFQWYVSERLDEEGTDLEGRKATFGEADAYVKRVCGIASKVEFDHDDAAWQRFESKVRRPFLEFAGGSG